MLGRFDRAARYARLFGEWRVLGRDTLSSPPEDISIEVTNNCNFKCHYCPQSAPDHFDRVARAALSPEQAAALLGKLRRGGVRTNVIHWTLDGEPFVNRQFGAICDVALRFGFTRHVFATNGVLATPARIAALPRTPATRYQLYIDFCADASHFETWRGPPGSWRTVRDNLAALGADARLGHVSITIGDIAGYRSADPVDRTRRLRDLQALVRSLGSPRVRIIPRLFHNMTGHLPRAAAAAVNDRPERYHRCPYPWISLVVASNGDVVACCRDLDHKTVLGNLFTEELPAIWNGPRYRSLRRALVERAPGRADACRECDLPWDHAKFSFGHLARMAIDRMQLLAP